MENVIDRFKGDYAFLGNFAPCKVIYEGKRYPSVEHAFQAAKSLDPDERLSMSLAPSCRDVKKIGRLVKLRDDWEDIKDEVMYECVMSKFTNSQTLREKLLATGDAELVEGNNHRDQYWGVYKGEGKNMLGKTLMRVREELRHDDSE